MDTAAYLSLMLLMVSLMPCFLFLYSIGLSLQRRDRKKDQTSLADAALSDKAPKDAASNNSPTMNELMEQLRKLQSTVQSNTEAVQSNTQAVDSVLANLAMPFKTVHMSLCTGEHGKDCEEEDKVTARLNVDMASVQWPALQPIEDRKEALAAYKREMEIGKGVVDECERRDVLRQSTGINLEFEETMDEVRVRLEEEYHKKHGDPSKKSTESARNTDSTTVESQDTSHNTASAPSDDRKTEGTPTEAAEAAENDPRGLEALGRVLRGLGAGNVSKVAYINYAGED